MAADESTHLTRTKILLARTHAAHEWSMVLGDTTSCEGAKDGRSHPAAKFHEGKVAALGELSRRITDDSVAAQIDAEATIVRARWAAQVTPGLRQDRDWEAYRAGGIQALNGISVITSTPS